MFLYCESQARDLGKLIGEASPIAEETTTTMVDTTTTSTPDDDEMLFNSLYCVGSLIIALGLLYLIYWILLIYKKKHGGYETFGTFENI